MHNETEEEIRNLLEEQGKFKEVAKSYIEDITSAVDAYVEFAMRMRLKEEKVT